MRKNVASQHISFALIKASDGSALTGASPSGYLSKDGAAQAALAGSFSELGNGQYDYAPTQTETNCNEMGVLFIAATAVPVGMTIYTTAADPSDAVRLGLTAMPNAAAAGIGGLPVLDANLLVDADVERWRGSQPSVLVGPSGTCVSVVLADWAHGGSISTITLKQLYISNSDPGQSGLYVAAGGGGGNPPAVLIDASGGTGPAMMIRNFFGSGEGVYIYSASSAGLRVVGTPDIAADITGNLTGNITGDWTGNLKTLLDEMTAVKIILKSTVHLYTNFGSYYYYFELHDGSTQDGVYNGMTILVISASLPNDLVYVGKVSGYSAATKKFIVDIECAAWGPSHGDTAYILAGERVWDQLMNQYHHNTPQTAALLLQGLYSPIVHSSSPQGVTINTLTINSLYASAVDDYYVDCYLAIYADPGAGQSRRIIAYNGTTRVATLERDWETIPTNSSKYTLISTPTRDSMLQPVEGSETFLELLRIIRAMVAGLSTGHPDHPIFYGKDGITPRLEADVDADGNRTNVVTDGT